MFFNCNKENVFQQIFFALLSRNVVLEKDGNFKRKNPCLDVCSKPWSFIELKIEKKSRRKNKGRRKFLRLF